MEVEVECGGKDGENQGPAFTFWKEQEDVTKWRSE